MGRAWIGLAALSLLGCLDVAEERARIDSRVGRAEIDVAAVRVDSGSAAVRTFADGELRLWASAPTLSIALELENDAASSWEVRIENAMPDAELTDEQDAEPLAVETVERAVPTDVTFRIDGTAGGTVELSITVADADSRQPYRYAVFADVQSAIDDVQDIYTRMNAVEDLRFVVMSGDLTEQGEPAELRRFQRELKELRVPVFSTLGNHELGASEGNYHRHFGRGNHHFTFRGTHFTLLDDASATLAPVVYDWLDGWLEDGRDAFHSVYMHIPPLDASGVRNGAIASRAEANMMLGKLARAGVDLTVYGHVHSFYAYQNAGIPAFITGGGGAIPERLDRLGRHFVTVTVDPQTQLFETAIVNVD